MSLNISKVDVQKNGQDVALIITGTLSNLGWSVQEVTHEQSGPNAFVVNIIVAPPPPGGFYGMAIKRVKEQIDLGTLESGAYEVEVNGTYHQFQV